MTKIESNDNAKEKLDSILKNKYCGNHAEQRLSKFLESDASEASALSDELSQIMGDHIKDFPTVDEFNKYLTLAHELAEFLGQ